MKHPGEPDMKEPVTDLPHLTDEEREWLRPAAAATCPLDWDQLGGLAVRAIPALCRRLNEARAGAKKWARQNHDLAASELRARAELRAAVDVLEAMLQHGGTWGEYSALKNGDACERAEKIVAAFNARKP